MLTTAAVEYAKELPYRASAEQRICWIPHTGIFWTDEIPDLRDLWHRVPLKDRRGLYRLLYIRTLIWFGEGLSPKDEQFWSAARAQVPAYALFHRLEVPPEVVDEQRRIQRDVDAAFEYLEAEADEVDLSEEDGIQSFSLTFNLAKDEATAPSRPWWKRLLGRR